MNQWKFEEGYNVTFRYRGFDEVHTTTVWASSEVEAGKTLAYDEELVGVTCNPEARKYASLVNGVWHQNNPLLMEKGWDFGMLREVYITGPVGLPGVYTLVRASSRTRKHLGKEMETVRIDMILPESCTAERDVREFARSAVDSLWDYRVTLPPFIEICNKEGYVSVIWCNSLS